MILFFLIFLFPIRSDLEANLINEFIVWNVGQGSWATLVRNGVCDHFDSGGEFAPQILIRKTCAHRSNRMHYSHWDWDHVSFAPTIQRLTNQICLSEIPAGEGSNKKKKMLARLKRCDQTPDQIQELSVTANARLESPGRKPKPLSSNEVSRIFTTSRELVPGDSIAKAERNWATKLVNTNRLSLLVLGHHGSRTSTSPELLNHLPHLRQAVASARFRRYGHPHREVVARLRSRGIAVLRTEDWGSIHFGRRD